MLGGHVAMAMCAPTRSITPAQFIRASRKFATISPVTGHTRNHKIVVVGGGSAGLAISHQLLRQGKFSQNDIAVVDPATWHHYQPGWTLVGGGLKTKESLRKPLRSLIDPKLRFYNTGVEGFSPDDNFITLRNGDKINYDQLVVAPGITVDSGSVKGLPEALSNPDSSVSSAYHYDNCDKVFGTVQNLRKGRAIFTQPAGIIKCAGAPQKIMWLALDYWKRAGLYDVNNPSRSAINITFATGLPTMFGVPKYNAELEKLRKERSVEGLFQHDLIAIDGNKATFTSPDGKAQVTKDFDLLHVVPKNRPHDFVKNSVLANDAGFVDVNEGTLRHQRYHNIWSAGDASSLPTSKTVAAITGQAPVLVGNLLSAMDGKDPETTYDGYTSCPLVTEYGKLMLAEFKYGGVPKETFGGWFGIDQAVPRREFYYMKKDFFPWVYGKYMVKGTWGGPKGWIN
jgi:NADPH-dependent 2,4-dienoyl-CoA reductase/sulfur reductase-like enzyme